jgi:protease-4
VEYNPEDPVKKVFGKFASQIGYGFGETVSKGFASQLTHAAANDKGMQ